MIPVRVSPTAYRDLARLGDFLDLKNPRAAHAAADAMLDGIQSLGAFPERGRPLRSNLRELAVVYGRDGYVIRYRLGATEVFVIRIFHARERR